MTKPDFANAFSVIATVSSDFARECRDESEGLPTQAFIFRDDEQGGLWVSCSKDPPYAKPPMRIVGTLELPSVREEIEADGAFDFNALRDNLLDQLMTAGLVAL